MLTRNSSSAWGRPAAREGTLPAPQLLVGRSPDRIPELPGAQRRGPAAYGDASDMRTALEGASTLILVSGHRTGRRLEEHATVVEAHPRGHRRRDHGRRPRRGAPLRARRREGNTATARRGAGFLCLCFAVVLGLRMLAPKGR
ncbi:hypothetical protein [Streptomyces sp. NPDC051286]|uniref:hypothetical protein n=1 Tax=Streptomyces sp. NPDC051286 TaxID=3365647 RepID=UPI00378E3C15